MIADLARFEEVASTTLGPKEKTFVPVSFFPNLFLPRTYLLRLCYLLSQVRPPRSWSTRRRPSRQLESIPSVRQCSWSEKGMSLPPLSRSSTQVASLSPCFPLTFRSSPSDPSKRPRPTAKRQDPRRRPLRSRFRKRTDVLEPVLHRSRRTARNAQDWEASVRFRRGASTDIVSLSLLPPSPRPRRRSPTDFSLSPFFVCWRFNSTKPS